MPVEIRELIIRASVTNQTGATSAKASGLSDEAKAQLVQQCVQQVMRILRKEQER